MSDARNRDVQTGPADGDFETVLATYIDAIDSGQSPNRTELLDRYPQFKREWTEFFELHDRTDSLLGARCGCERTAEQPAGGSQIGDFQLLEEIGRGGMGVVYKARQVSLDRVVAVKLMRTAELADQNARDRFRREATAAAQLAHPGIVRVYEVGQVEGIDYLVMDYIEGQTLADVVRDCPLGDKPAARWLVSVARAIEHAHGKGVLHRDLKPRNVLVDRQGEIHVSDFGLAKRAGGDATLTRSGDVLGTPAYMSPEQARAEHGALEVTSDVYSLGAILYELVTGRPPFAGQSPYEILRQVESTEPVAPRSLNPGVSRDLETICLKCLEKEPSRRYATVRELREDLEACLDDRPIRARPVTQAAKLRRWARRNPFAAGLLGVIGLLLVVAAVVPWAYSLRLAAAVSQLEHSNRQLEQSRRKAVDLQELAADQREQAISQRDQARLSAYVVETRQALGAWENSDLEEALRLLARHEPPPGEPDRRGWEWYLVRGLCAGRLPVLRGHDGIVLACDWHPDGKRIASAGADGTIRIWDADDRRQLEALNQGRYAVTCVRFAPDGKLLAAGSLDGLIRIWDPEQKTPVRTIAPRADTDEGETWNPNDAVEAVAWSPDAEQLAGGRRDGRITIWDPASGEKRQELAGHAGRIGGLAWSPSGHRLASCAWDQAGRIWDPVAGTTVATIPGLKQLGMAQDVAWSPAGDRVACATWSGIIAIADAETGRIVLSLSAASRNSVRSVDWNADGTLLASIGYDRHVRVWAAETGNEVYTLRGHSDWGHSVRFSPDGTRLATAGKDGTVRVWPLASQLGPIKADCGTAVYAIAVSPDGKWLAGNAKDNRILLLSDDGQQRWSGHQSSVYDVAWRADGKRVASTGADRTVRIWDFDSGRSLHVLEGHKEIVFSLAWRPDGKRLASIDAGGNARVWNAETGDEIARLDAPLFAGRRAQQIVPTVTSVAWSPDGSRLALCRGTAVSVWDADGEQLLFRLRDSQAVVLKAAWSPDGTQLAASGLDGRIRIWNVETRKLAQTLYGHANRAEALAWHPDGKRLASGSWDKSVRIWNLETGDAALTLRGHTSWVTAVCWHPDGKRLFSGGWDGAIRLWDAGPGYEAAAAK